ncbi:putative copper amine oxidase [Calycina marina]|uniref:Amine oxidase n=1 Tax=Calycina marina TaxID=1763456 RepID=A0A9P8CEH1_9HELO|nr:putative copper amine oxidase [Calycina marina]
MHPLDPITAEEITGVATLVKAREVGKSIHFKKIAIVEPPKRVLRSFLTEERSGKAKGIHLPRRASALYYYRGTAHLFLAKIDLDHQVVEHVEKLETHFHGQADPEEAAELRDICLNHPRVLEAVKNFGLPKELTLVCDTWPYGRDSKDNHPRLVQCYLFARGNHPGSNHYDKRLSIAKSIFAPAQVTDYTVPLPFAPVFDMASQKLIEVIHLPTGADFTVNPDVKYVPHAPKEYHHALQGQPVRQDLKPLVVHQPQGVSFTLDGYLVRWQKWRFRLGFNWREGMVLHDVTYDGRELFHRLSLSEMFVPYADPRHPYSRKSVFDVGDIGAGVAANNLALGCDCLGVIKYFSFVIADSNGNPAPRPNAVCMHEIDDGIGWKHTNIRNGVVSLVRSRVLVLQTIITVGNYEYVFMWNLDQAAGLHYKIQATGILSTHPIDEGTTVPWGTNVNIGVMAPFHQHIFSLRIDPCIDGDNNTLIEEDSVAMPFDEQNPYGIGYVTKAKPLVKSTYSDSAPYRTHKIINCSNINKSSGKPVSYAIHSPDKQMLLAHPKSWHGKRAKYGSHHFWVTAHNDGELHAAGDYTYQSTPDDGKSDLAAWVDRADNTEDTDIVVWHSISLTHNPRTEDYPVMPCDTMIVSLKPSGFFDMNPALDVPQSMQETNSSRPVKEKEIEPDRCCNLKDS